MAGAYPVETMEVIPRDLCLCWASGDRKFYLSPFAHIMGHQLRISPEVTRKSLEATQKYNRQFSEAAGRGEPPYEKLFPWPEELPLDMEPGALFDAYRELVRKKEGAYTLVDATPGEAFAKITLNGNVLSAEVKSKSVPEGKTPRIYDTMIKGIFLDRYGNPDLISMECNCGSSKHARGEKGGRKNIYVDCLQIAGQMDEFAERVWNPNPRKTSMRVKDRNHMKRMLERGIFSPFSFAANWYFDRRSGTYRAKNRDLAALEWDALLTYFTQENGNDQYFGINRRLFMLDDVYPLQTKKWIGSGAIRREIIRQKGSVVQAADANEKRIMLEEKGIFEKMLAALNDKGFRQNGYFLEMGQETAWCLEDRNKILGLLQTPEGVFCTERDKRSMGPIDPTLTDTKIKEGPYVSFGWFGEHDRYCDLLMRNTQFDIQLPSALRLERGGSPVAHFDISEEVKQKWRHGLSEANKTKKADTLKRRLKYAGLGK
jgi:hypothetical protein